MPEVKLSIIGENLAGQSIQQVEAQLRQLQTAARDVFASLTQKFGEFAGGRAFVKGSIDGLTELKSSINDITQQLGQLKTQTHLGELGLDVGPVIREIEEVQTAYANLNRNVINARTSMFANPGGDTGARGFLDNIERENKADAARLAEKKRNYDQETALMQKRARESQENTNRIIADMKREASEQERAYRERTKFQAQVAPQSSVSDHRRFLQDIEANELASLQRRRAALDATVTEMGNRMKKYYSDQATAQRFLESQGLLSDPIKFGRTPTGGIRVLHGDEINNVRRFGEEAEKAAFKAEGGWRHVIAVFDEFQRGQRGAMIASSTAFLRDTGLMVAGAELLKSSWGMWIAAVVAGAASVAYVLEQMYQRFRSIQETEVAMALQAGMGTGPQQRADIAAYYDRNKAATAEYAGTERELQQELNRLPTAAQSARQAVEDLAKSLGGLQREDPSKAIKGFVDAAKQSGVAAAKFAEEHYDMRGITNEFGQTLSAEVSVILDEGEALRVVTQRTREHNEGLLAAGTTARTAQNNWWLNVFALMGLSESGNSASGTIERLSNDLNTALDPAKNAKQAATALAEAFREQNIAIADGLSALRERSRATQELGQAMAATKRMIEATGRPIEGTIGTREPRSDIQYDQKAIDAAKRGVDELVAKREKSSLTDSEERAHQKRLNDIAAEAEANRASLEKQAEAADKRVEEEKRVAELKFTGPGIAPDEAKRRAEQSEQVQKAEQQAAEAHRRVEDEKARVTIAGIRAQIDETHRGTAERLALEEQIIAITKAQVAEHRMSDEQLAQELIRQSNLKRQFANEEFGAARDIGRAQIEEAKEDGAKINQVYRDIWQEAIRTGQSAKVFQEITREWVRDINTARQRTFEIFSAGEREKVEEARGDWAKIMKVYQEWSDFAAKLFGQNSREWAQVQRDMVKKAHEGLDEINREEMKGADARVKLLDSTVRMNQLQREAMDMTRAHTQRHHETVIAGLQAELAEVSSVTGQEIALYEKVVQAEGIKTEAKLAALEKESEVAMRGAEKEMEIAKKINEEHKKAAEESMKIWTDFGKKLGDDFSTLLEDMFERKPTALYDFLTNVRKQVFKLGENLLAQQLAKSMGVDLKPGEGMGGLFGGLISKALGLEQKDPGKETVSALKTANQQRQQSLTILSRISEILDKQQKELEQSRKLNADARKKAEADVAAGPKQPPSAFPDKSHQMSMAGSQADQAIAAALEHSGEKLKNYCAKLVNESLEKAGVKGSGSALASSFKDFGTKIDPKDVQRGDVFYVGPSGRGDTGHVGMTLGPVTADKVEVISSHMQGAASNPAGVETRSIQGMEFHRPAYAEMPRPRTVQKVDISHVGGSATTSAEQPGALPTAKPSGTASGPVDVAIKSSVVIDIKTGAPLDVKIVGGNVPGTPATASPANSNIPSPTPIARQFGGLTPPNSSDTVPAWLTPGERVLNLSETEEYQRMFPGGILGFQEGGLIGNLFKSIGNLFRSITGSGTQSGSTSVSDYWRKYGFGLGQQIKGGTLSPASASADISRVTGIPMGGELPSPLRDYYRSYGRGLGQQIRAGTLSPSAAVTDVFRVAGVDSNISYMPLAAPAVESAAEFSPSPLAFNVGRIASAQGGLIPFPTSMPSDVKAALSNYGGGLPGRRAYGPGVSDSMGGMLAIVHPGEMIVPADVVAASSQGGLYDKIGTESRGFQSVATVPVQPGLGKWGWLLYALAGIGGIAAIGSLFSDDDKKKQKDDQALADKLLKSPEVGMSDATQTTTPLSTSDGDLSPIATTSSGAPTTADSGSSTGKNAAASIGSLTTGVNKLTGDLGALSTATTGTTSQTSAFGQSLGLVKGITSTLSSIMSIPKQIGGIFSGLGSLFGGGGLGLFSLFGLSGGGIIPSAAGGMIVPRFQGGGILSMVHANEMVLPAHISQMVQNAANTNDSGPAPSHTVNFHINTIDQRTGAQFLMNNADAIARAYARSHRSYSTSVPR
jgi:hypothetical protein